MKIKKVKFKQILKLHLLNSRAYEHFAKTSHSSSFLDFNMTQSISDFKRILHIIYQFHSVGKKILFIGVSKKLELKINKLTPHLATPSNFDLQGFFLNNQKLLKEVKIINRAALHLDSKLLFPKLLERPDLVVLFSHEKKQNIINESHVAKIPLILFNAKSSSKELSVKSSYNVLPFSSNSGSVSEMGFLLQGLNFLFKKS